MGIGTNFEVLSDEALARFVRDQHMEFSEEFDTDKADQIVSMVRNNGTGIERRPFGFAIVHPIGSMKERGIGFAARRQSPVLWYFYIAPSARGTGVGRAFLADVLKKFARSASMALLCHGTKRRDYFAANGFVVAPGEDESPFVMNHPGGS